MLIIPVKLNGEWRKIIWDKGRIICDDPHVEIVVRIGEGLQILGGRNNPLRSEYDALVFIEEMVNVGEFEEMGAPEGDLPLV